MALLGLVRGCPGSWGDRRKFQRLTMSFPNQARWRSHMPNSMTGIDDLFGQTIPGEFMLKTTWAQKNKQSRKIGQMGFLT